MEEFKSFYKRGDRKVNTWCRWNDRIDPYGRGCAHDCSYCYAKSLLDFRKLWNPAEPAVADKRKIRGLVSRLPKDKVIRIGGMTDPFQPIELKCRVTYALLEALKYYRIPYLIVTKSDLIASPEYVALLDRDLSHIQITITTLDDALARTYEHAPAPSRRVAAIERLQELGFDIQVRLSPFIPEYVDRGGGQCDKVRQNTDRIFEGQPLDSKVVRYRLYAIFPQVWRVSSLAFGPENRTGERNNWFQGKDRRRIRPGTSPVFFNARQCKPGRLL